MLSEPIFKDRHDAGRRLAGALTEFAGRDNVIVLAVPRGGVPVGYEMAKALEIPLDVFIVRKLGVPGQEELAFGAIASGGIVVYNDSILRVIGMPEAVINNVIEREQTELRRRENLYREGRPALDIAEKTAIVVDDGLATGASMLAAVAALEKMKADEIVVAVPVSSMQSLEGLNRQTAARCIAAYTPEPFYGVGMWYKDFSQTSDEEVQELLTVPREIFAHAHSS
ncbi:MAG TPA: phosphoribosyltransferase [Pyrinomonadaceae bacterium]